MANAFASRTSKTQSGYSLIEVLIALFVLSVGILAMVNLQGMSLRDTISALNRTRAVLLSNDFAERILANKRGISNYVISDFGAIPSSEPSPICAGASATACSPAELAAYDLWHWKTLINDPSSGLPGGAATTTVAGTKLKTLTISIQWQDQGDATQYTAALEIADSI